MIYLAIDPGIANTGIAISYEGSLCEPLTTIPSRDLVKNVLKLIKDNSVDVLVIGEPQSGPAKDLALILKNELSEHFKGKIVLHPEDYSSKSATKKMIEGGVSLMKRRTLGHAAAAALILEDFLESNN